MSEPLRVLIAEDEIPIAMGLSRQLSLLGHTVVGQAVNGREAVEMAAAEEIDLAVLDIRMPELDGIEAAREIQKLKPVPVIIVTAYCDDELVEQASDVGAYAYLSKPIRPQELRTAIALATRRFTDQGSLAAEVDQLKLTLEQRKLIEKAKGIAMARLKITEEQAYQRMRGESQNTRRPMVAIASAIIEADAAGRSAPVAGGLL